MPEILNQNSPSREARRNAICCCAITMLAFSLILWIGLTAAHISHLTIADARSALDF